MTPGTNPIIAALTAGRALNELMNEIGKDRRANPKDDLTSQLLNAEVDGETLTDQELASFFVLLVVAGNETTRNAISHGMKALSRPSRESDASGPRTSSAWRRPRSRRSCAGRRR